MKDLKDYVKSRIISLYGLEDNIVERLSNLRGRSINECCGCMSSDAKCVNPEYDNIAWYNSEYDIVNMLMTYPKVQDMFNLRTQMTAVRFKFIDEKNIDKIHSEPLYFRQQQPYPNTGGLSSVNNMFNGNAKLYKFIEKLTSTLKLSHPVVLDLVGENLQLFFIYTHGSNNGRSIKDSLTSAAKLLGDLEQYKEINWSQVLDVSIDNLDGIYDFVVTVTCNKSKFLENFN